MSTRLVRSLAVGLLLAAASVVTVTHAGSGRAHGVTSVEAELIWPGHVPGGRLAGKV